MIGVRAVLKGARCTNCRLYLTDAFPAVGGNHNIPCSRPGFSNLSPGNHVWKRRITQLGTQRAEHTERPTQNSTEPDIRAEKIRDDEEAQAPQEFAGLDKGSSEQSTPWYLQVKPPERESVTLSQRQKLPDLPPDPPPLLQSMLEHIFIDLGLDDVVLFDLRDLDPPPALGANVVMVICTARSEKHLHVSADKFCQWMKNTHQIAPYADGLLGRGELKLKLKRKAKRARILSRVGSTETNQPDDGIRTGWICATVDNLEDGRPIQMNERNVNDFVGFESEEHGAKVIIQMLTQEKREELDLEDLWGGTIRRHQRKQARISQGLEDPNSIQQAGQTPLLDDGMRSNNAFVPTLSSSMLPRVNPNQIRHMHTAALHRIVAIDTRDQTPSQAAEPSRPEPETKSLSEQHESSFNASPVEAATSTEEEPQIRDSSTENVEISELEAYLDFAANLPSEKARFALGNGGEDTDSTLFLRSFYDAFPWSLKTEHWMIWLSLLCMGTRLGALGYSKHSLALQFYKLQSSLMDIPASSYKQTLTALLTPTPSSSDDSKTTILSTADLSDIIGIFKVIPFRRPDFIAAFDHDESFRELLEVAILQAQNPDDSSPSLKPDNLQRLRQFLDDLYPSPPSLDLQLRKMQACADAAHSPGLWDVWRSFAVNMDPRPAELYVVMFHLVAEIGHATKSMEAMRVLVPEMSKEEPPVEMDRDIAEAIKRCISVADPKVEEFVTELYEDTRFGEMDEKRVRKAEEGLGEFEKLWLECDRVIDEQGKWARESDDD